ncbi:AraC family transcriptional regulator [Streptomyces longispororuber]|uniref:AraC family transcriptional regulator n=1 Tax=Streptomyces longispororuber TaxID=68230 RepID=A0A918Z3W0_9ACTN|nr:AraC family transcriptional regulator [Streptomyces longispororuber]GHE36384.1 AraC family transcriptional regulator [Streptomyces longispororuber]
MRGTTVLPGGRANGSEPERGGLPIHRLEVPRPNALPFAIGSFDTIGPMSRASFPHRHTFHEIVYVTGGTGSHVVDLSRFTLRPPHLCFLAPGQVHYWDQVRDLEGCVILFTDDFLLDNPRDQETLRRLGRRSWLKLSAEEAARVHRLVADLDHEYRTGAEGFQGVLQALLHVLVVRAARLLDPERDARGGAAPARPAAVAADFLALMDTAGTPLWSVRECAARLGVSVSHLNEVVKTAMGRTPGELLRQARVHEAKRLLLRTELTVRQVAGRVGFTDPAYFCRFFRRETGTSPGDFRRGGGDIHHDHRLPSIARNRPSA